MAVHNLSSKEEFWRGSDSPVLLNPSTEKGWAQRLASAAMAQKRSSTIWVQSSGTESQVMGASKLVALPKKAFLHSARSVVESFHIDDKDVWLNPLPNFHVGGIAIFARSFISGCKVVNTGFPIKWSAESFLDSVQKNQVSVSSLVPTQIYDLVDQQRRAPSSLRFIFVGGGALSPELYVKARRLGWPLLPSYGMTETCAMIAVATKESIESVSEFPLLRKLPHVQWRETSKGNLWVSSPALASGYLSVKAETRDWVPFADEFISDDRVRIHGDAIQVLGRESQLVKVLGESVNLQDLTARLEFFLEAPGQVAILARPHERRGFELLAVCELETSAEQLQRFNSQVASFERLVEIKTIESLPRTELGKIKTSKIPI